MDRFGSLSTLSVARDGGGHLFDLSAPKGAGGASKAEPAAHGEKLGQWRATSIAGNDLLSSCLYTAGICAGYAGKMAPASLLAVSVMLYLFRFVYGEVVTAMPVNGGSYTALSNTTSKRWAALAAACSLISYVATAVVSAESAVNYAQLLLPAINNQASTLAGTIIVLGIFAALNLLGLSESANVATGMFVVHFFSLILLVVWSFVWAMRDNWDQFRENLDTPYPQGATWASALYFGYSAALLGITGFETAANYVEEMESSTVYVQVLRNMWFSVAVLNPLIGFLALAVMPVSEMYNYNSNLLGPMAQIVGGDAFQTFICIDGVLVLAGSVLTAYVGIGGLLRRMALDRILPSALLARNSCRGTHHWIILAFFGVCSSLLLALNGNVMMLGSVYNIAFLSVMSAFAFSCLVLKFKRPRLPRKIVASVPCVLAALVTVLAGLAGNIIRQPIVLAWFLLYYACVLSFVQFMFNRVTLLVLAARAVRAIFPSPSETEKARKLKAAVQRGHSRAEQRSARRQALAAQRGEEGLLARRSSLVGAPGDLAALMQSEDVEVPQGGEASPRSDVAAGLRHSPRRSWFGTVPEVDGDGPAALLLREDEDAEEGVMREEEEGEEGYSPAPSPTPSQAAGMHGGLGEEEDAEEGCVGRTRARLLASISARLQHATQEPYIFFAKTADLSVLNKVVRYVRENESTARLVLVHVANDRQAAETAGVRLRAHAAAREQGGAYEGGAFLEEVRSELASTLRPCRTAEALAASVATLNAVYPKLHVTAIVVRGTTFGPAAVKWTCGHVGVGPQNCLMAMPDERASFPFAALGGVRVITRVR